jgi:ribonuclease HI
VLKGITEWIHSWKKKGWKKADGKAVLNRKLWRELDYECCLRTVEWKWVKGHTGDPYNERCDELAREAISSNKI